MPIDKVIDPLKGFTRVPIKIWATKVEESAEKQLKNVGRMPFIHKHVAAMADVHAGKGSTIGTVIATKGAIIPAAVGVDIGCGMMALKLTGANVDQIRSKTSEIRTAIESVIPVGHRGNQQISDSVAKWQGWVRFDDMNKGKDLYQRSMSQMCSLGGGNHFMELSESTVAHEIWIMLHSGSRNIGKSVADMHIHEAKGLMQRYFIDLPDPDLAYFVQDTPEFKAYISDLRWLQDYAFQNRIEMMTRIVAEINRIIKKPKHWNLDGAINCHHNYVVMENHFGHNVWVTRKGAIRAQKGELGIVPGSMGTLSYIVKGLGNPESFQSCAHGAGRVMSRTQARNTFSVADLIAQTEGVDCPKDKDRIDEIPAAYKDINEVIHNQRDLAEPITALKQFLCVKG